MKRIVYYVVKVNVIRHNARNPQWATANKRLETHIID